MPSAQLRLRCLCLLLLPRRRWLRRCQLQSRCCQLQPLRLRLLRLCCSQLHPLRLHLHLLRSWWLLPCLLRLWLWRLRLLRSCLPHLIRRLTWCQWWSLHRSCPLHQRGRSWSSHT